MLPPASLWRPITIRVLEIAGFESRPLSDPLCSAEHSKDLPDWLTLNQLGKLVTVEAYII